MSPSQGLAEQAGLAVALAAWEHELRGPHGEWVRSGEALAEKLPPGNFTSDQYKKAIRARLAGNVRRGMWVAWADTVPDSSGFGFMNVFRPVQITSVRHKTVGRGAKRHKTVTITYDDGNSETFRAGATVDTMDVNLLGRAPAPPPEPEPQHPHDPFGGDWLGKAAAAAADERVREREAEPHPHPYGKDHFGKVQDGIDWINNNPDPGMKDAISEVQHGLDLQGKDVPGLADHQVIEITDNLPDSGDDLDPGALGETMRPQPGSQVSKIYVKPTVTAAFAGPGAEDMLKNDEGSGWWVPVDHQYSLADLIVAHETGHAVANRLPAAAVEGPDLWGGLAKILGVPPPLTFRDRITRRTLLDPHSWVAMNGDQIGQQVSRYATTNQFELEAELWAEYTLSSHPRPPAKFYGDYVMAHLPQSVVAA